MITRINESKYQQKVLRVAVHLNLMIENVILVKIVVMISVNLNVETQLCMQKNITFGIIVHVSGKVVRFMNIPKIAST